MNLRKTLWLTVNGVPDTLARHLDRVGYRKGFQTTMAKRHRCRPSEIPVESLRHYFAGEVHIIEMPDDWREIVGQVPKVNRIMFDTPLITFLTMKLSSSPRQSFYYLERP